MTWTTTTWGTSHGNDVVPPIKQIIPTLAAKVDEDGNEIAGVKSVLQAPLGTYTSWNPVAAGPLKGNEGSLAAGYIAFPMTKAERLATGDPRRSSRSAMAARRAITAWSWLPPGGRCASACCCRWMPTG